MGRIFSQMLLKRPHTREWYLFPEVLYLFFGVEYLFNANLGPQFGGPPFGPDIFPDASQAPSYERMVSIPGGTVFIFGVEYLFNANFRAAIWWTTLWAGIFPRCFSSALIR